jgi:hypothetical protein
LSAVISSGDAQRAIAALPATRHSASAVVPVFIAVIFMDLIFTACTPFAD